MRGFVLLFVVLTASPLQAEVPRLFREKPFTSEALAEAANHFIALGEEAGMKELESLTADPKVRDFKDGFRRHERIGWVCRILFEPKGNEPLRPPAYGGHDLPTNTMPLKDWPLYPLASSASTYFVLSEGYNLGGKPENPKHYLSYCRDQGKFRTERVPIPTRAQALKDLEQLRQSEAWKAIQWQDRGQGFAYTFSEDSIWAFIKAQAENIPAKPGGFGKNGYVTREDLANLPLGPAAKDLALGVYLPTTSVPVGEPLWAYFVVKNTHDREQGLDMRFDFLTGQTHGTTNSCSFTVKPLTDGVTIGPSRQMHTWECGGGPLVNVAGNGFYVAALDLAAWGKLRPGDYEVSWQYSALVSNTVRFTVLAGEKAPADQVTTRQWNISEVAVSKPKRANGRETWGQASLLPWYQGAFSAALGSGVGDRHVTNLELLPASDELLSVSATWELGEITDRVTLHFSAKDPKVRVSLNKFHLYLLADFPGGRPGNDIKIADGRRTLTTPYFIEVQLPSSWRTRPKEDKVAEKFQAAFLLTSSPLREPGHRLIESGNRTETRIVEENPAQVWEGLLKTSFQEIPSR